MPEWTFGPCLSGRLGVTIYPFGPKGCRRLSGRLDQPIQQPSTSNHIRIQLGYLPTEVQGES